MTSMEHEAIKLAGPTPQDLDLEEGEVTDDSEDGYIPLQRPEAARTEFIGGASVSQPRTTPLDTLSDQDDLVDESEISSDDSDDEGASFGKRMRGNNDKKIRIKPPLEKIPQPQTSHSVPNKYNIWTESLQEDTLMETMRGCDVTLRGMRNRDVESYDYNLKYRMNGDNAFRKVLKRRQSNSDDSDGYNGGKRFRSMSFGGIGGKERKNVKLRLGKRNSSDSNSNDSLQNAPRFASRHILDLNAGDDCVNEVFAAELANKLCEEKDELMLRIVTVLGKEISTKLFKETQKIEADGGMLIMNGARRRTPGGVFLFLLKHNEEIDKEAKKAIFLDDRKVAVKERKHSQAVNREKKVEELKKKLSRQVADNELPTRNDLLLAHLKPETHSTLSNPPPSPVGYDHREGSPDFEPQNVHVNVTSPEKAMVDQKESVESEPLPEGSRPSLKPEPQLQSYEDDYLDMTCDDMDLF